MTKIHRNLSKIHKVLKLCAKWHSFESKGIYSEKQGAIKLFYV